MGASSSTNQAGPSLSISTSDHEAETSSYAENARFTNDNDRQSARTRMSICNGENEPLSQGPSPYATLKTDESWKQRPTAPCLTNNAPPPKREALLTYAAQMTGWQSADGQGPVMYQQNNETVELSRIISQLAMANHQLASVHNATLARMEALYMELSKEKEHCERTTENLEIRNDTFGKRMPNAERDVEWEERLERCVVRLESLLADIVLRQGKQRGWQGDDKSRCGIDKLENLSKTRERQSDDSSKSAESRCELSTDVSDDRKERSSLQRREERSTVTDVAEVSDDSGGNEGTIAEGIQRSRRISSASAENDGINISRIDEDEGAANVDLYLDRTRMKRARLRDEQNPWRVVADEEKRQLVEEIERLKADRSECRRANEKLLSTLADREALVKKLSEDYEEYRGKCDESKELSDLAGTEIERLLKQIDTFQSERNTARERISSLEQDLRKSRLEMEQTRKAESEKASKLRAQLSEEVSDKKKQTKALENALEEIERLKETAKTEGRNEEDIAPNENANDVSDGTPDRADIEDFKKELTLKREARQRAIAAVSSEMERLRRELDAEKEAHSETSKMFALFRSSSDSPNFESANESSTESTARVSEERQQTDEREKEMRRIEAQRLTCTLKVSDELRGAIRYQIEKVDDLRFHLETDAERHRYRIRCLTEASEKARESLGVQERRSNELKNHLAQVLVRLGDRSFLEVRDDAGTECDRQVESVNALRDLYNERLRVLTEMRESACKELTDVKQKLEYSVKRSENLQEELKKAEEKVDTQDTEITSLESQLGLTKADCRDLQNQMSLINGLFTQMLLGASSADMDLDRLTQLLQENHDLISDIAREESTEAAALPKLLLDLVEQVEGGKASQRSTVVEDSGESNGETDRKEDDLQQKEIAHNLPKVWRVLFELLSCHAVTSPSVSVASCSDPNSCYKSVDTPAGPTLVISVSKTYIRLKELILEKKHLEKEMNRMKQLNTHLESKLGEQEKRLSMVSAELTKTWNIVGRMQAQHQQLHTHEEILRYELQQKRKMLQELKQELEYCREKWESARQKNTNTELEWRSLRREFAARKALAAHDSFNNSAESGFSDERGDDTDEEDEEMEGRIRHGPRRRTRKEGLRAPTPDTESEQPTDTEVSESKTGSSATMEQRTPTPETETELDEAEAVGVDPESVNAAEISYTTESTRENFDPLDQALTNVIQNLIRIDDGGGSVSNATISQNLTPAFEEPRDHSNDEKKDFSEEPPRSWTPTIQPWFSSSDTKALKRAATNIDLPSVMDDDESIESLPTATASPSNWPNQHGEIIESKETPRSSIVSRTPIAITANASSTMCVFSIGPLPTTAASSSSFTKNARFDDPSIVASSNRLSAPVFGAPTNESPSSVDNSVVPSVDLSSAPSLSQGEETDGKEQRFFKPLESVTTDSDSISVDSSSSLDTVREFPTIDPNLASTSVLVPEEQSEESATSSQREGPAISSKSRTPEEALAARADRLKRLEEQADWLMKKMNATSKRGSALCTRLEELHEVYGEPPVPPPMPDVLPSRRLPCSLADLPGQVPQLSSAVHTENTKGESSDPTNDDDASPSDNAP